MSLMTGDGDSLWQALASIPDHRRAEGKRYPLASLLLIAVAAMLSGRRDQLTDIPQIADGFAGSERMEAVARAPCRRSC